jgi:hypothetical protein
MAKQIGPYFKVMCKQNLQFYKMDGKFYVRKKSSLTGKRVRTDKAFTLTMVHAGILATASPIAKAVYNQIPKETRQHSYFRSLVRTAIRLIKEGKTKEVIYQQLYNETFPPAPVATLLEKETPVTPSFADEVLNYVFSVNIPKNPIERNIVMLALPP